MIDISIIIPSYYSFNYIQLLIHLLNSQTYLAKEIIIVDSGLDVKTQNFIKNYQSNTKLIYKKIDKQLNPGSARNIGVGLSNCDWLAFLDSRTYPECDWLEDSKNKIIEQNLDAIIGTRRTFSDSSFKTLIRSLTYGDIDTESLTGTIIKKNILTSNNFYFATVRAGEDLEWLNRIKTFNLKKDSLNKSKIIYCGLLNSYFSTLRKWNLYSYANANIIIDFNNQKKIYFFSFILFSFFLFFFFYLKKFNLFTIPISLLNIIIIFLCLYFLIRGIIMPIHISIKRKYLFPFNWILIALIGLTLDIIKAPGLVYGYSLILKKKLKILLNFS